ncbi:uncharacterized protein [Palaemon carinicauda]|uniref:uncharacterized protein n=1 Tax=Palaemon carinicauda TaxID=392227 RepID=UPI0035B692F6
MLIHYGVVISTLLLLGSDANVEFYTDEGVILAQRFIAGRRRFLDRESPRTKPVVDENLLRLLTEFGGGHVTRLLREFSDFNLGDVSSLLSALGGFGDSGISFDDVAKVLTELERRGFRRGENGRGMREDMIEAIKMMKGDRDESRDSNSKIRVEGERGGTLERGFDDSHLDAGLPDEETLYLLLQLLTNEDTKGVSSLTNSVIKRGGRKGEIDERRRNVESETEQMTSLHNSRTQRTPVNLPGEVEQEADNLNIDDLLQLSSLIHQLQKNDGNRRENQEVTTRKTSGNIITEGAVLAFELGSLVALAGISTLGAAAGFAEAGLGFLKNGLFDAKRDFSDPRDSSNREVEGSRSTPNFEVRDIVHKDVGNGRPISGSRGNDFASVPGEMLVNPPMRDLRSESVRVMRERVNNDRHITRDPPRTDINPSRPYSHDFEPSSASGRIPEVQHSGNTYTHRVEDFRRTEDTTENVRTGQSGGMPVSHESRADTTSGLSNVEVYAQEERKNDNLGTNTVSSPFVPNERFNENENTFRNHSPTRPQGTRTNSNHRYENGNGNSDHEYTNPVSTRQYLTPDHSPRDYQPKDTPVRDAVGEGDNRAKGNVNKELGETSEKTDNTRDPPRRGYEFEINPREPGGDKKFDNVFGGTFLPADTIYRAAVRGESPHYVFEGGPPFSPGEAPLIRKGLVRHVGSFTSTQEGKLSVRIYGNYVQPPLGLYFGSVPPSAITACQYILRNERGRRETLEVPRETPLKGFQCSLEEFGSLPLKDEPQN